MSQEVARTGGQAVTVNTGGMPPPQSVALRGERAAAAVGAREQTMIIARFQAAFNRPRSVDQFRARLLQECKRTGFADTAMYARPVGKEKNKQTGQWEEKIATGPSIRLIETALTMYANVKTSTQVVYDDDFQRTVLVAVIDFETNVSFEQEVELSKIVEKRAVQDYKTRQPGPPPGREVLGERINSQGEVTYIVRATEDELTVKQAAAVSKAIRTQGKRLLPPDVIADAVAQIEKTLASDVQSDPTAAKKKLLDAFAGLGIMPADIEGYLKHSLDRLQPAELQKLRTIYASINSGESTWDAFLEGADGGGDEELAAEKKKQAVADAEAKLKGQASTQAKPAEPVHDAEPVEDEPMADPDAPAAPRTKSMFGGTK